MNIEEFYQKSKKSEKENKQLLFNLKKKKPSDLDSQFQKAHDAVFKNTNCLECANCCKTTSPIFTRRDIERLSKFLGMKPNQFIDEYLHIDADEDYVLNVAPCPFLGEDNYCSVYEERPTACQEYPHTDSRKMVQLMDLTFNNTKVCPAVLEIVQKIKDVYSYQNK